jgi:hypothetical protein
VGLVLTSVKPNWTVSAYRVSDFVAQNTQQH